MTKVNPFPGFVVTMNPGKGFTTNPGKGFTIVISGVVDADVFYGENGLFSSRQTDMYP